METRNAKEIRDGLYQDPEVYRMYLHKSEHYRQHGALLELENNGNTILYVTSQAKGSECLARAYHAGRIVSQASAMFTPSEIVLPDTTQVHHVSFKAEDPLGYVYSEEAAKFERRLAAADQLLPALEEGRKSRDENHEPLGGTVGLLSKRVAERDPLRNLIAGKPRVQQASILACFLLDAQLTFVKQE